MRSSKSPTRRILSQATSRELHGAQLELLPQPSSTSSSAEATIRRADSSSSGDEGTAATAQPQTSAVPENRSRGSRESNADADPLFDWTDETTVRSPRSASGVVPSWTSTCVLLFIGLFTCPLLGLTGCAFALAACIAGRKERQPYALVEGVGVGANPDETRWRDRVALAVDPEWAHRSRRRAIRWRVRARSFAIASVVSGAVVLTIIGIIITFGWIMDIHKTPFIYQHSVKMITNSTQP